MEVEMPSDCNRARRVPFAGQFSLSFLSLKIRKVKRGSGRERGTIEGLESCTNG